jgi:hypothetical protein
MSGALLQLAALSSQDIYLTGNPEITLFKKNYMRYTNFSTETVQVAFDGGIVNFGSTATATLEKTGDLISRMVLVVNLEQILSTTKWGYVDRIGHAMIDNIRITIGQSDIDIVYQDWIDIYQRMNKDKSQEQNYNIMIGNVAGLKKFDYNHDPYKLFIPLEFWMGKNTSSAFPICALVNQQFQVTITFRNQIDVINYYGDIQPISSELPNIVSGYLLVDYIYLETTERNLFKTNNHEYLIEVVQDMTDVINKVDTKINLIFDKPTKYLIWYVQLNRYAERHQYMSWASDDNWELARQNFAKLVWLITRDGLDASDPNNPIINFNTNYVNIGQVPETISGGNSKLASLASKVNGLILFAENSFGDIIAKATTDNVILTKNEITYEDMSTTIEEFKTDTDTTEQQINFLNIHTLSIIDIFNYANFINRSDNPVINSSFQLNGKNRFQERDGYFYNYIQPYYYFTNSPPDGVNAYTFSLNPNDTQPSGTINLGYINSKDLLVSLGKYNNNSDSYLPFFQNGSIRVLAYCYNLLKIFNGSASLGY